MAERLEAFEFSGRGRQSKYNWNEWLDGSPWRLVIGVDFDSVHSFRQAAYQAARIRRGSVRTEVDGDFLVLQFESVAKDTR